MSDNSWLTYEQLLNTLDRLCTEKSTGTVLCVTDDQLSITISIQSGVIVGLGSAMKRGLAALDSIRTLTSAQWKYTFNPDFVLRTDDDLPNNSLILHQLRSHFSTDKILLQHENLSATITSIALHQALEEEVNKAFGPIGSLLYIEQLSLLGQPRNFAELEALLIAISHASGEAERATTFQQAVWARIKND